MSLQLHDVVADGGHGDGDLAGLLVVTDVEFAAGEEFRLVEIYRFGEGGKFEGASGQQREECDEGGESFHS